MVFWHCLYLARILLCIVVYICFAVDSIMQQQTRHIESSRLANKTSRREQSQKFWGGGITQGSFPKKRSVGTVGAKIEAPNGVRCGEGVFPSPLGEAGRALGRAPSPEKFFDFGSQIGEFWCKLGAFCAVHKAGLNAVLVRRKPNCQTLSICMPMNYLQAAQNVSSEGLMFYRRCFFFFFISFATGSPSFLGRSPSNFAT